jgi:hypothetical protein
MIENPTQTLARTGMPVSEGFSSERKWIVLWLNTNNDASKSRSALS